MDGTNEQTDIIVYDLWAGAFCLAHGARFLRVLPQPDGRSYFVLSNEQGATYALLQRWRLGTDTTVDGRALREAYSRLFHESKAAHGQRTRWDGQQGREQHSGQQQETRGGYGRDAA